MYSIKLYPSHIYVLQAQAVHTADRSKRASEVVDQLQLEEQLKRVKRVDDVELSLTRVKRLETEPQLSRVKRISDDPELARVKRLKRDVGTELKRVKRSGAGMQLTRVKRLDDKQEPRKVKRQKKDKTVKKNKHSVASRYRKQLALGKAKHRLQHDNTLLRSKRNPHSSSKAIRGRVALLLAERKLQKRTADPGRYRLKHVHNDASIGKEIQRVKRMRRHVLEQMVHARNDKHRRHIQISKRGHQQVGKNHSHLNKDKKREHEMSKKSGKSKDVNQKSKKNNTNGKS
jgi:hypothetical protein